VLSSVGNSFIALYRWWILGWYRSLYQKQKLSVSEATLCGNDQGSTNTGRLVTPVTEIWAVVRSIFNVTIIIFSLHMYQFTRTEQKPKSNTERVLKLSRQQNSIFSRADSRVHMWRFPDVSGTKSISIFRVWCGLVEPKLFWDGVRESFTVEFQVLITELASRLLPGDWNFEIRGSNYNPLAIKRLQTSD
jgi:hypothetical protein